MAYIGAGDTNDAQTALNILSEISVKYSDKIKPLAPMLRVREFKSELIQLFSCCSIFLENSLTDTTIFYVQVLLNKLTDISLNDVLQLMDMLCFIAFSEQEGNLNTSLLKDDITKMIEKQIASSNIK